MIEDFNLSYKTRVLSIAAEYQYRNKNVSEIDRVKMMNVRRN